MTPSKDISRLVEIMAALRDPETGCPWDLKQTFATIAPYTIEEAYEVADAIARGDPGDLRDELGDLLLQVVYHARMAEEQNAFAFADVVDAITTKMIRRHPHVFGTPEERAAGAAPGFWERAKTSERSARVTSEDEGAVQSVLADVPVALPALTRAVKLQNKAARVGFDWPSLAPVFAKLKEEIGELEAEIDDAAPRAKIEEEFGDLLFVIANVARHLKLDPEAALRAANEKFIRRFRYIEAHLAELGRAPAQSTLAEMDTLWDEAKASGL
jgi:nucleoside triphosphate diphosphatase